MQIENLDPDHLEARRLISDLDADLIMRYPGEVPHGIDAVEFRAANGYFAVLREAGDLPAVACGAFRPVRSDCVEIKRMYVAAGFRGQGYAKAILYHLEKIALERGFTTFVLETGIKQPEAIGLYRRLGYFGIPAYGEYVENPNSVCFQKRPAVDATTPSAYGSLTHGNLRSPPSPQPASEKR